MQRDREVGREREIRVVSLLTLPAVSGSDSDCELVLSSSVLFDDGAGAGYREDWPLSDTSQHWEETEKGEEEDSELIFPPGKDPIFVRPPARWTWAR